MCLLGCRARGQGSDGVEGRSGARLWTEKESSNPRRQGSGLTGASVQSPEDGEKDQKKEHGSADLEPHWPNSDG